MIVCHCHVVSDRDVRRSVASGARSLAQVCQQTGAGRDCGACVFSLKRAACEHVDSETRIPQEAARAAS